RVKFVECVERICVPTTIQLTTCGPEIHHQDATGSEKTARTRKQRFSWTENPQTQKTHSSSFHLSHTKQGIIFSQAIRYHRICSDPNDRNSHLNVLSQSMRQKGYKPKTITTQINSAVKTPRTRLLQYKEKKYIYTSDTCGHLQPSS
ncbi:Hypothetical predicted protein, partial [Pelobates cultripes]